MISRYSVLVDSSIWISWFKNGEHPKLDILIQENLVCTNEIILTELLPVLKKQGENEIIDSLLSFPRIPDKIDWDIIREYQNTNLTSGINKVGIPDLMILHQVISQRITLFSTDNHFKLMNKLYRFDLMSD